MNPRDDDRADPNDLRLSVELQDRELIAVLDRHLTEVYANNFALFEHASGRAVGAARVLFEEGLGESAEGPGYDDVVAAFTKIIFTFTNPEDFAESITDADLEEILTHFYRSDPDRPVTALGRLLNVFAGHYYLTFSRIADVEPIINYSRKFWFTVGYVAGGLEST